MVAAAVDAEGAVAAAADSAETAADAAAAVEALQAASRPTRPRRPWEGSAERRCRSIKRARTHLGAGRRWLRPSGASRTE